MHRRTSAGPAPVVRTDTSTPTISSAVVAITEGVVHAPLAMRKQPGRRMLASARLFCFQLYGYLRFAEARRRQRFRSSYVRTTFAGVLTAFTLCRTGLSTRVIFSFQLASGLIGTLMMSPSSSK